METMEARGNKTTLESAKRKIFAKLEFYAQWKWKIDVFRQKKGERTHYQTQNTKEGPLG